MMLTNTLRQFFSSFWQVFEARFSGVVKWKLVSDQYFSYDIYQTIQQKKNSRSDGHKIHSCR